MESGTLELFYLRYAEDTFTQCDFSGYLNYTICTGTLSAKGIYIMKLYFALLKILNYSCYIV